MTGADQQRATDAQAVGVSADDTATTGQAARPAFPLPDRADPVTGPFWRHAAAGRLALPRCPTCDQWRWYPTARCTVCDGELDWHEVAPTGTVFAFTVVHRPFLPQMTASVPYVAGLVTADEAPEVRIATRFTGDDLADLRIGDPVVAVFAELRYAGVDGSVTAPLFARAGAAG